MQISSTKIFGLLFGLIAFASLLLIDGPLHHYENFGSRPAYAAAVVVLMAIWWFTEALPIHYTACLPVILFPLLGVFGSGFLDNLRQSVTPFLSAYVFLFAGGMCISAAMQQCNLDRRIALNIMKTIGAKPGRLLFGLIVATAFISLWISNTATATMMMPIALSIILQCEKQNGMKRLEHYGAALMLAVAYAANVGGIGTKIGTAPNSQLSAFLFQIGIDISFLEFMLIGTPFVLLFLPIVWLVLWNVGKKEHSFIQVGESVLHEELRTLGSFKSSERIVSIIFVSAACLWIMGQPLVALLKQHIQVIEITTARFESYVAVAAAFLLFCWRHKGTRLLELSSLHQVPWSVLLLFGGGLALAAGTQSSGMSEWIGLSLGSIQELSPFWQVLVVSCTTVALTAIVSNSAAIAVMLPILQGATPAPLLTTSLFASSISASCDFALPSGTPPNAIVFGSGYVTIPRMIKTGLILDCLAAVIAAVWCWMVVSTVL